MTWAKPENMIVLPYEMTLVSCLVKKKKKRHLLNMGAHLRDYEYIDLFLF